MRSENKRPVVGLPDDVAPREHVRLVGHLAVFPCHPDGSLARRVQRLHIVGQRRGPDRIVVAGAVCPQDRVLVEGEENPRGIVQAPDRPVRELVADEPVFIQVSAPEAQRDAVQPTGSTS